jgi:hypothetical protein
MPNDPTLPQQVSYELVNRLVRRVARLVPAEHQNAFMAEVGKFAADAGFEAFPLEYSESDA